MISAFHILLAALAIGFLIFIHEFGHYLVARRQGMVVEVFSIGFGRPIVSWMRDGVKWQVGILPFGGYVKIAGMEKKGNLEPHQIRNGFYGKGPWARIKVALAGPIVNVAFALAAFCVIWSLGGRDRPFSSHTHHIGYVNPESQIYASGVRSGDVIQEVNGKPYNAYEQLFYAAVLEKKPWTIRGEKVDYFANTSSPFQFTPTYESSLNATDRLKFAATQFAPASFLIFPEPSKGQPLFQPLSPISKSGIRPADRLMWANDKLLFSTADLTQAVNDLNALITVERGQKTFVTTIPRIKISDLKLSMEQKGELDDWKHEANLNAKLPDLFFIPYNLNTHAIVEDILPLISYSESHSNESISRGSSPELLKPHDRIIAIDGIPIHSGEEFFREIQTRRVLLIVKSNENLTPILWTKADTVFTSEINWEALNKISSSIGTDHAIHELAGFRLLQPVIPKTYSEMGIKGIESNALALGVSIQDRFVAYNPSPITLFLNTFNEMWRTIVSMFSGHFAPKMLSGPIGIIQVMEKSWEQGVKEALYWMAVISLNLGVLNLLPLPVLDGGHICFALWESVTKRRIKSKTMERMIVPFVVLFIAFFIYITYHDIIKLFK